jgi:hypothetical protein
MSLVSSNFHLSWPLSFIVLDYIHPSIHVHIFVGLNDSITNDIDIESRTDQKFGCATSKPVHAIHDHEHHDTCGHERVPHDDHFDYLVGDELHHQHDGHCDSHGIIRRRFGRTQGKSKVPAAKFKYIQAVLALYVILRH